MAKSKPRRVIRRVQVQQSASFEDQLWPVNLAILILSGFVLGVIIARLDYGDPRLFYNGWTWTSTLIVSVSAAILYVSRLDNRTVRRSVQLATVLSIMFHLWLAVMLSQYYYLLPGMPDPDEIALSEERDEERPVSVPIPPRPDAVQDFELPVETETPESEKQLQVERPKQETPPVETPEPPRPDPEPPKTVEAEVPKLNRPEQAAARRSQQASIRSRNMARSQPNRATPATVPKLNAENQNAPSENQKAASSARQDQSTPKLPNRSTQRSPSSMKKPTGSQTARRESTRPDLTRSVASRSSPRRSGDQQVPRTSRPAEVAGQPRQTTPTAQLPQATAQRQQTASPSVNPAAAELPTPSPERATAETSPAQRQTSSEPAPQLARTVRPDRRRNQNLRPQPAETASAAAPRLTSSPSPTDPSPSASDSALRQTASLAVGADSSQAPNVPAQRTRQVAHADPSRVRSQSQSSSANSSRSSANRRRAARAADVAASPVAAPSESLSTTGQLSRPNNRAARSALSRGRLGLAGAGRTPNFGSGPAAPRSPAMVASAAAFRSQATQKDHAAGALSPSRRALAPRRRAASDLPTSTIRPDDSQLANVAGASRQSEQDADASAARSRSDSSAQIGDVTAAAGTAPLDTGAPKIVSEGGARRAAGGGQPAVGNVSQSQRTRRQRAGGASLATLDADKIAETPEAPESKASAGGAPNQLATSTTSATSLRGQGASRPSASDVQSVAGPTELGKPAQATTDDSGNPVAARGPELLAAAGSKRGRKAAGPDLPAALPAKIPTAAGAMASTGKPDGAPLDAAGDQNARTAVGLRTAALAIDTGATQGQQPIDAPESVKSGEIAGRAQTSGGSGAGDAVASSAGGRRRANRQPGVLGGLAVAEVPDTSGGSPEASPQTNEPAQATASGSPGRRSLGPLALAEAPRGPGGLGAEPAPDAGISQRPSKTDSILVSRAKSRLRNKSISGLPNRISRARLPATSYAGRRSKYKDQNLIGGSKPSTRTEAAIEAGLDFLARHQSPEDGRWSLHDFPGATRSDAGILRSDTAATGLALLSFLGAAYDHYDDKYQDVVAAGLNWLLAHQTDDGNLYVAQDTVARNRNAATFYSHAIGTMALCEAYGMTGDEKLRGPAQKAIDYIVATQSEKYGGWRYIPGKESDTSVTGWQLMALKSGELAHLEVPKETFEKVSKWLDRAQVPKQDGSRYAYRPYARRTSKNEYGHKATAPITAVGLLMRLYLGWDRTNPSMAKGADYLLQPENLPSIANKERRNTYYWYYATQLQFHMGGERWKTWYDRLQPLLAEQQVQRGRLAGSWDPQRPVADRWGYSGGRIYVTTLNILSMEVHYRHLPIYEETGG